jgi:hypothetical protein
MSERRTSSNTKRQCARFGCSAIAVATFTFDSQARTVWLDTPLDGNARAGELCGKHARALTPPRGWQLEDRRPSRSGSSAQPERTAGNASESPTFGAAPTESTSRPLFAESGPPDAGPSEARPAKVQVAPARQLAAGPSGAGLEAELRGLLDAHSPLLARAFRSSGTV